MNQHDAVPGPWELRVADTPVAEYHDGSRMAQRLSPRPYLHPVRTLGGTVATQIEPEDHLHHYGVSNAIADIDDVTYWGGASYVHPDGYTMLPNQGTQRQGQTEVRADGVEERVEWLKPDGEHHLSEDRRLRAVSLPQTGDWALLWHSLLHADAGDLVLGSPATRGRVGAGYGGLFWRVSAASVPTQVTVADGEGDDLALGSLSPWLLLQQQRDGRPLSLLLVQPEPVLPWFVRTSGYVGAGPAVAWTGPHHVAAGDAYGMSLGVVVSDDLTADAAPERAASLRALVQELGS